MMVGALTNSQKVLILASFYSI